jgi:kynurenine formamidase
MVSSEDSMQRTLVTIAALAALAVSARAQQIDLARYRVVDLTHSFDKAALYWPSSPSAFVLDTLSAGMTPDGYFYSAFAFSTPEHGGTHLDAPYHFSGTGNTVDRVPLTQLIAPAVVIDISARVRADRDYQLTVADLAAFEARHGRVPRGAIVLLRTDWSKRWSDPASYFGDSVPKRATHLHFPSYGLDAARVLVLERGAGVLGLDTPSIDYGPSQDFVVHRMAMGSNVAALENLTSLDQLPPTGALVIALPMKIAGGSGGPLRAVALVPR